jgi:hypothetical protein
MNHTPTPWELIPFKLAAVVENDWTQSSFAIRAPGAPGGIAVTIGGLGEEEKANAELIVKAVNNHERMVKFARRVVKYFGDAEIPAHFDADIEIRDEARALVALEDKG